MSAPALGSLSFPGGDFAARGRPWRVRGAHGRLYARLEPELAAAIPRWLAEEAVPEGHVLKPPAVLRVGDLVVKLFPPPSVFGWVRAPRAVRSAARYSWCLPLRSPRPLLAAGRGLGGPSLLVREHVEGELLSEVWRRDARLRDARAEDELAGFLASMERHGILHGDLHPRNLLWTGAEWVLLDVDGLRHRLHDPTRVLIGQWARFVLHLGDEERVRALHARTSELVRAAGVAGPRVSWERVRRQVEELTLGRKGAALP